MGDLRQYPLSPIDEPGCALGNCPRCDSKLLQPQGWKELSGRELMLHLRCAECQLFMVGSFDHGRVAAYDKEQVQARRSIESDYASVVRRNMEELAERLALALDMDLIGPDDFAPATRRYGLQSPSGAIR